MRGLRSTAASLPLRQADLRDMNPGATSTPQPHLMSEGQPPALSPKPGEQARNKGRNHPKPVPGSGALQLHNRVRLRMSGVHKHRHDPAHGWMFSLVGVNTVNHMRARVRGTMTASEEHQPNLVPPCGQGTIDREQTFEGDLE